MDTYQTKILTRDAGVLHIRGWGSAPPRVLLIHGFGDGSFVWDSLVQLIGEMLPVAAVDLRGHGDSSWDPFQRYQLDAHVEDVKCLLETMGWRNLVLAGHSLGSHVAIRVATNSRARGLLLIDGGPELPVHALDHVYLEFSRQAWHYASIAQYLDVLVDRLPLANRVTLSAFACSALRPTSPGGFVLKCDPALRRVRYYCDSPSMWHQLEAVKCPTLLVRASMSAFLPLKLVNEVTRRVPSCELVVVPNSGHAIMLDNPSGLHAAIRPFLRRATGLLA
jgi:pimeloyl-ACP methyl ester carboxylesterase